MKTTFKICFWLAFIAAIVFIYGFPMTHEYDAAMKIGFGHGIKVWYLSALFISLFVFIFSFLWAMFMTFLWRLIEKIPPVIKK